MGNGFDYSNMTDHDLLVITAQNVHIIKAELKGMQISQGDLNTRVIVLETRARIKSQNNHRSYTKIVGGGTGTLGVVSAIIYGAGRLAGWW